MAWKRIDSIAKRVIDRLELDAATVGAVPRYGKGRGPKPPASATGQRQREGDAHPEKLEVTAKPGQESPALPMGRCMTIARPTSEPHRSAVVIHPFIAIEGGRQTTGGGGWSAVLTRVGRKRRSDLMLVK